MPGKWAHEKFTCCICHREVGENDFTFHQKGRAGWCLKCLNTSSQRGAGIDGPAIAVWDEKEVNPVRSCKRCRKYEGRTPGSCNGGNGVDCFEPPEGTILVRKEIQMPSVVEDMIEMDRIQDLRDQVQAAGVIWVEDEKPVKKCRKNFSF